MRLRDPRRWARALPGRLVAAPGAALRWLRYDLRRALAAVLLLAALAVIVGGLTRLRTETGLDSFLPSDDVAAQQFDELARGFGGDPVVVLLESPQPRELLQGDRLDRLVQLEGTLAKLPDVATVYGPGTLLNQIAGRTQDLLAELSGTRDADRVVAERKALAAGDSAAAATAAADAAAAFDDRYAPLLAQGLPAGLPTLKNPSFVNTVVFGGAGTPRPQWRFVVPSDNAVAILVRPREGLDAAAASALVSGVTDAVGRADLGGTTTVSGVPAVVAALSDQTARSAPLLGGLALIAVSACFLLVRWARRRDRLIPVATTVTAIAITLAGYGWIGRPVSLGVVAFLSVVLGVGCYYPTYLLLGAPRRTVLTVALATALSFGTLVLSPLPLVRDLGVTLACGVLVSALVGLTAPLLAGARPAPATAVRESGSGPSGGGRGRRACALGSLAVLVAVAGVGWAALPSIPLRTDVDQFAGGLSVLDDAQHVEDVIGSSGEVDVVLRGPDTMSPAAFAWLRKVQETVVSRHGDAMRPVVSPPALLPFLGPNPTSGQILAALQLLPRYLTGAVLSDDRSTAILSFGVRLEDLDQLAAARDDLRATLPPPPAGYDMELTGLPMVAVRGSELVSADRVLANILGIVVAGTVLAVGLRRRTDAVLAVGSAVLATGTGLFLIWLSGTELTPITVALGSLTAAVGCEFAVVLAEAARRGRSPLRIAVPLVTGTSVLGYAVLLASGLQVVRQFGLQLAVAVVLSMLSSLVVLWVLRSFRPPVPADPGAQRPSRNELSVVGAD